jgi:hypothetical protein
MMNQEIAKKLNELEQRIDSKEFLEHAKTVSEWGGADVIITSRLNDKIKNWQNDNQFTVSLQDTKPQRRVIITKYSKELSSLFYELRNIFLSEMDHISKYDFYGLLAQSAIDYLETHKENVECAPLLMAVLDKARSF